MRIIKVGTDFSGIGSPEAALTELKNEGFLNFESEFSCEIDKFARLSHKQLHKSKVFYEDITKRNHSEVPKLDLYVAGFPCQAFSIAGKQKGFEDVRGTLFFNVADFIRENQPETFILENVKGLLSHDKGRTFQTIIDLLSNGGGTVNGQMSLDYCSDGLGYHIHFQVLNTKEHGIPQNRERIFIVGFKKSRDYSFPIAETLNLRLKDLLETEVDEKYFLSDKTLKGLLKGQSTPQFTDGNDIARCFTAGGNSGGMHSSMTLIGAMRGRNPKDPKSRKSGLETKQMLEINENGTSNCLTSVQKDNLVVTNRIRRLTPLECWRLQGFSDSDFYKAKKVNSDTQLYKQAGNSISVRVIKKIIKNIYK